MPTIRTADSGVDPISIEVDATAVSANRDVVGIVDFLANDGVNYITVTFTTILNGDTVAITLSPGQQKETPPWRFKNVAWITDVGTSPFRLWGSTIARVLGR